MLLAHVNGELFRWSPYPSVWVVMIGALVLYALAVRYWGPEHVSPAEPAVTRSQVWFFGLGVGALWIGADWPVHDLAENYLFSAHMVQHMLFTMVGAPLLLLGTPDWMARRLLKPRWLMAAMKRLTRPLPALLLFNGLLVFTHWPWIVNTSVSNEAFHFGVHVALMASALIMWWPVFSPMTELPRISPPGQMLYLFGQTIVPTVPASFLTFAEHPLYGAYAEMPRLFPGFDAVADAQVSGLIMKLGGGLLLWGIIAYLFFKWAARQESGVPDETTWQELEREVNKMEVVR